MVSGDFDQKEYQKMVFIMNALNDGWSVKKNQDTYIFKKKHENKVETQHIGEWTYGHRVINRAGLRSRPI